MIADMTTGWQVAIEPNFYIASGGWTAKEHLAAAAALGYEAALALRCLRPSPVVDWLDGFSDGEIAMVVRLARSAARHAFAGSAR